jgi:predicted secreted protein
MKRLWAFGVLLGLAFAGDLSVLRWLGFSADGRYLAFQRSWEQDGSGFLLSDLTVVDVLGNGFVRAPFSERFTQVEPNPANVTLQDIERRVFTRASPLLRQTRVDGRNLGLRVLYRPLNTGGMIPTFVQPNAAGSEFPFQYRGQNYRVRLELTQARNTCTYAEANQPVRGLKLLLISPTGTRALQRDVRMPSTRDCVFGYHLEQIYVYNNRIAVFLYHLSPGFEGPDVMHMVVTGRL